MKETTVGASEFKAKCLRLLDEVAAERKTVIITKRGRPVARLEPVPGAYKPLKGMWKGLGKIKGDIVNFNVADEWESAR